MQARPFTLLSDTALAAAGATARALVQAWAEAWGLAPDAVQVSCAGAAGDAGAVPEATVWRELPGHKGVALAWSEAWPAALQRTLFGAERGAADTLAGSAAQAMHEQLLAALAGAFSGPGKAADAPYAAGSGALLVQVRHARAGLHCLVGAAAVRERFPGAPATPPAPLAALRLDALFGALPVKLPVHAGGAQVSLGTLASLAVGDVIRLDLAIERPLALHSGRGVHLCDGYLGLQDGRVGIEVIPHQVIGVAKQ
jgi:flagellar motor switch/type III secretory pathway protein FliN